MSSLELLLCAALISASAFLSASEVALFSLSRFQLRSLKERFKTAHKRIRRLLADPGGILVTILVASEVINISLSALVTQAVSANPELSELKASLIHVSPWAMDAIFGTLLTAPLILFACEITPKVVGARANLLVATLVAGPITALYGLLTPLRKVLKKIVSTVSRVTGTPAGAPSTSDVLRESDFLLMLEEGHKEGAIHENELELIKNVFEFDDRTIAEVFTPLFQVQTITAATHLREAIIAIRTQKFSRIPITSSNRRDVVGILYSKDLIRAKLEPERLNMPVAAIMKKPFFVPSSMRLNALFRKFKQSRMHMAVIQGSNGEALGVITMNDVLETLFEDLFPEDDA